MTHRTVYGLLGSFLSNQDESLQRKIFLLILHKSTVLRTCSNSSLRLLQLLSSHLRTPIGCNSSSKSSQYIGSHLLFQDNQKMKVRNIQILSHTDWYQFWYRQLESVSSCWLNPQIFSRLMESCNMLNDRACKLSLTKLTAQPILLNGRSESSTLRYADDWVCSFI